MTAKQAVRHFTRRVGIRGEMYMGYGLLSLQRGCWRIHGMYDARFKAFSTRRKAREYIRKMVSGWEDQDCRAGCYQGCRESESEAVIDELAARYPGTVDYDTEDGEVFCFLDKDDRETATVDEREMTGVWNVVELASPEDEQTRTEGRIA